MQTLVPIGTFEGKARRLLGQSGFDDMLELLARRPKAGRVIKVPVACANCVLHDQAEARVAVLE